MNRNTITALAVFSWAACIILTIWAFLVWEEPCTAYEPSPTPTPVVAMTPAPVPTPTPEPTPENIQPPDRETEPVRIMQGEFTVTAYCSCKKCCWYWATVRPLDDNGEPIVYTASGAIAKQGRTIAVDPEVFEYGTEVWLDGPWGVQAFIAEDCGYGVEGRHIDIYFDSHEEARQWGLQTREVWLYMKTEAVQPFMESPSGDSEQEENHG